MTVNVIYRRQARWFYTGRTRPIRLVVLHDPEYQQVPGFPKALGDLFATSDRKASAHAGAGPTGVGRYVKDADTAFHAAGANADGLGIEIAGFAAFDRAHWLNPDTGIPTLHHAADQVAEWCALHSIPPVRLTVAQVRDGTTRGITDHRTVQEAFPSTGHTDPGANFPFDVFLQMVADRLRPPSDDSEDDMTPAQEAKLDALLAEVKGARADATQRWKVLTSPGHRTLPDILAAVTADGATVDANAVVDAIAARLTP